MFPMLRSNSCFVMRGTLWCFSDDKQTDIIDAFNTTSKKLDDIVNMNNIYFYEKYGKSNKTCRDST